jgi:DnaJ-class molecular chaperone
VADPTTSPLADAQACAPCRGTGTLISTLGGDPSKVACPWCEGTGAVIVAHDAQAARRADARSSVH